MPFKERDSVLIKNYSGHVLGLGVIVNVNEFREPNMRYAVDAQFYRDDYIFVGEGNLELFEEVDEEQMEAEYKRIADMIESEGLSYAISEGYVYSSMTHDVELKVAIDKAQMALDVIEEKLSKYMY